MSDIPKVVLEQLEMVRMEARFNMTLKSNVQVAANDLGFSELVCFIEDLRGGWMPVLNALGNFTSNMSGLQRDALQATLDEAAVEEWDD